MQVPIKSIFQIGWFNLRLVKSAYASILKLTTVLYFLINYNFYSVNFYLTEF